MESRDVFSKLKTGKMQKPFVCVCEDGCLLSDEKQNVTSQKIRWEEASVIVTRDLLTSGNLAFLLGSDSRKKKGDRNLHCRL